METPKSQRAPQSADKYVLRLPDGMRDKIAELARLSNRSMNAEMVAMLQQAMSAREERGVITMNFDALADTIADRVAAKLREQS